ncbi:MAG: hypothetical protein ACLSB9_18530 [Hydrogeniiclostridium mannosilyticum]
MNASERHAVVNRVSRKDAHSLEVEFTVPGGFRTYPYAYVAIIDEAGTKSGTEKRDGRQFLPESSRSPIRGCPVYFGA